MKLAMVTTPSNRAVRPERAVRSKIARALGFNLIEMLMTISIAAILTGIAIPSFRYITNSNRIASELNGLLGDLQLARAEAIKEGRTVTVCQSSDSTNCTNNAASWQSGWIVFSDPANPGVWDAGETYIRKQKPFSGTDTFSASVSVISFNREGYAVGMPNAGTLLSLHDSSNNDAWTRCLFVNFSGQMMSEHVGVTPANGSPCT